MRHRRPLSVLLALVLLLSLTVSAFAAEPADGKAPVTVDPASSIAAKQLKPLEKKDWTIAIYLCGSDLERKWGSASSDLIEMLEAEIPDSVNVIVMTGGAAQWNPEDADAAAVERGSIAPGAYLKPDNEHTQLYAVDDDKMTLLYTYEENLNMGAPETVAELMSFALAYAPADHMMFTFWDHGGGPIDGAEKDENTGELLSLRDIAGVMQSAAQARGEKLDLIGFDCCLMSCLENAWLLSGSADYLLVSEETEPDTGWLYHWLSVFSESDSVDAGMIGRRVIDIYPVATEHGWMDDTGLTLALIDLSKVPALVEAVNEMGAELAASIEDPAVYALVARAAQNAHSMLQGQVGVSDLYTLASGLMGILPSAEKVIDTLGVNPRSLLGEVPGDGAVVYRGVTLDYQDCIGLSIYYPVINTELGDEEEVASTLETYRGIGMSDAYSGYIAEIISETDALQSFTGTLVLGYDSEAETFYFSVEDPDDLAAVMTVDMMGRYVELAGDGTETVYQLGNTSVDCDWEQNRFTAPSDMEWARMNGEPFTYTSGMLFDVLQMYTFPILVEGNDTPSTMIALQLPGSDAVTVAGVVDNDEDGNPSRNYDPEEGFTFCTLLMEESGGGYRKNSPITLGAPQEIASGDETTPGIVLPWDMGDLGRGTELAYDTVFRLYDMKGNTHYSDPLRFFLPSDISDFTIVDIPDQIYTGQPVEPFPTVLFGGTQIYLDSQFTVSYENNVEKGTAACHVDFQEKDGEISGRLTKTFQIRDVNEIFYDVPSNAAYLDSLSMIYANGIMNGTGDRQFSPDATLSRAMVVMVLHRIMGGPLATEDAGFADVPAGQWYTDAVAWAKQFGLVDGVDDTHFAPEAPLTREQLAVTLYRFAEQLTLEPKASGNSLRDFADAGQVDDYAFDAMRWAVSNDILSAVSAGQLAPLDSATRAQAVVALHHFLTPAE